MKTVAAFTTKSGGVSSAIITENSAIDLSDFLKRNPRALKFTSHSAAVKCWDKINDEATGNNNSHV